MSIDILLCVSQTWSERSGLPPKSHFTRPPSHSGRQVRDLWFVCIKCALEKALLTYTYTRFVLIFKCSASHFFFKFSPLYLKNLLFDTFCTMRWLGGEGVFSGCNSVIHVRYGNFEKTELNFIKANHCLFRLIVDNLRVYKSRKAHSNYISKSNVSPGSSWSGVYITTRVIRWQYYAKTLFVYVSGSRKLLVLAFCLLECVSWSWLRKTISSRLVLPPLYQTIAAFV